MRYRVAVRLAATLLVVSFVPAARANHTIFDYAVDRVEFDGNLHGPADGTPDVVEEFDDGVLGPLFQRLFGTVTEAGGYMILKNPGTHFAISGLPFETDQSDAVTVGPAVLDAAGNLVIRSYWRPQQVDTNHYLHQSIWAGTYVLGIALTNFDASIANLYNPPWPIGPTVTAHREVLQGFNLVTLDRQHVVLATGSATGAFVFELDYDDAAKAVSVAFSNDGGETFERGFSPLAVPSFTGDGQGSGLLMLGADPHEGIPAPPPSCGGSSLYNVLTTVAGLGAGSGMQKVKVRGYFSAAAPFNPVAEGATLLVLDDNGAVIDANMPAGPGCGPLDGWALVGSTYRYRNVSGGLPPTCNEGSGHKMTAKLRFENLNTARFKAKVTRTTIGTVSGPLDLDLIRNVTVDPPDCQHYTHAGYECQVSANKVKCH